MFVLANINISIYSYKEVCPELLNEIKDENNYKSTKRSKNSKSKSNKKMTKKELLKLKIIMN